MLKHKLVLFYSLFFTLHFSFAQVTERSLNNLNWKFRRVGDTVWYKATVPGTIHTDLYNNHLISDPFYGDNEKQLQWIDTCDWEYKAEFNISEEEHRQAEYLFAEGLDTYASVYLNNKLIDGWDNMFFGGFLTQGIVNGKNVLKIVFHSAIKYDLAEMKKLPYILPGEERVFSRKAQYQYGWDFAPKFITCGIGGKVSLELYSFFDISRKVDTFNDSLVVFDFHILETGNFNKIVIKYDGEPENDTNLVYIKNEYSNYPEDYEGEEFRLKIHHPRLWWCNGMGEHYQYHFHYSVFDTLGKILDSTSECIGLRTIELVQDSDKIGKSFYFKLNGVPVFIKGADYIPPDVFLPRVTKGKYDSLVDLAALANMNMLRIWGGGVYPDEEFYKECDRKGILVWQDFMFACGMYPLKYLSHNDYKTKANLESEIDHAIVKSGFHPCIALFCGNNEIKEGWYNWGWQKQYQYSSSDSVKIWKDYRVLFDSLIPDYINIFNRDFRASIPYVSTSPQIGWGHEEAMRFGDSHYWGVWWGMEPFEIYNKKVPRFMSEYGFQSMPDISTLSRITDTLSLSSIKLKNHQKHPTGFQTIDEYMKRDFKVPSNFADYVYTSQLLQAEGMQIAIEAHRRHKPYCMGTLYWQFNDCWPAISWSSIDYYGTPKACYYRVKELYDNILISVIIENEKYNVYIVSDSLKALTGALDLKLLNFDGDVLQSKSVDVSVPANSSAIYYTLDKNFLDKIDTSKTVLECTFMPAQTKASGGRKKLYYFCKPKNLSLVNPGISFTMMKDKMVVTTKKLAKNVYLHLNGCQFSDNYFDLLPGESKAINYYPINDGKAYTRNPLEILTLFEVMNRNK